MSSEIFKHAAPKFWSLDLKAIPIELASKRPAKELTSWQGNLAAVPNDNKQKAWLETYASYGVGLLTGGEIAPDFVLVGMDVDDDRLVEPIQRLLNAKGGENCGKRGKKGVTIFVRMPKGTRSTTLKGTEGLGSIDVLSGGKLTVMPPSIHPDTQEPYVDWKTSVLDANLAQLPLVTSDELKAISVAMGSEEILAIMEGKATHDPGVSLTARLVAKGVSDEDITAIFTAFLPEGYRGDTLQELPGWIDSAREKGFESSGKGRSNLVAALVQLAQDEGCEFFHDGNVSTYVTVPTEAGTATFPVDSGDFRRWLRHRAYRVLGKPAGRNPLSEAVDTLEALALFSSDLKPVFRRVGGDLQRVEIDLGRPDGHVVSITSEGWTIETAARHKLVRGGGFQPLPNPVKGAGVGMLQALLGLDDEAFRLVLAFLVNALNPKGPYFILLIEGEQGSGKSFLMDIIKRIIDPNLSKGTRLPDNERDLMVQAEAFWLLAFDNASGMKGDISDALCALATGGAIAQRKLFTDKELSIIAHARPFIINGIASFVSRPDLMERGIPLRLPAMPDGGRKEEAVLLAEFDAMLPEVLGGLYDAVSAALRERDNVQPPTNLRMADAARWIMAGETVFDFGNRSALDAIAQAQDDLLIERVNDEPLVIKLREARLFGQSFEGTIGELFASLECSGNSLLPRTPSHLSKALVRLRPAMARAGVHVEFLGRSNKGMRVRVRVDGKGMSPTVAF